MPWVRFDDQFPLHRKIRSLSDARYRLVSEALFWCNRNLTDGRIYPDELTDIRPRAKPADAVELIRRGVWHPAGFDCPNKLCPASKPEGGGWQIHDYWDFQPSKEKVQREREAARERQRKWREQHRGENGQWNT